MFKIVRQQKYKAPNLKLDGETLDEFGRIAVASILTNIRDQKQADGSPLKRNAPSTRQHKIDLRLPNPDLALVWIGRRLVKGNQTSFEYQVDDQKHQVTVRPSTEQVTARHGEIKSTASPAALCRYVQRRGYVGWFGINEKARLAMRASLRKFLERQIRKARGGGGGSAAL